MNYADDGITFFIAIGRTGQDDRVPGSLSVKQFNKPTKLLVLPPTNPGMPMYLDSPGFCLLKGNKLSVLVPVAFNLKQSSSLMDCCSYAGEYHE